MPNIRRRSSTTLRSVGSGMLGRVASGALTSATSLTVTDYANQRIYQRVGTSKSVTVSGTYDGYPNIIQARAAPHGTSASSDAYSWTNLVLNPTGGTYSGTLSVSQGGWYVIQVRDGVDTAVRATGSNKWGVGIIVAVLGQSNMQNMLSGVTSYPLGGPTVCNFDGTNWDRIGNINDTYPPNTLYGGGGYSTYTADPGAFLGDGFVYMANYLQSELSIPVGTLAFPVGGTRIIQNWYDGEGAWQTFETAAISATGGDFECCLWFQGESDAPYLSTSQYKTALGTLHTQLKTLSGRATLPLGLVTLGPILDSWANSTQVSNIRAAQLEYLAETANTFYAATAVDQNLGGSNVHVTNASLSKLGRRYANAIKQLLAGTPDNSKGPTISSATRTGTTVTVNITHGGGSSLQDGAGGSGGSLLGWRVFDAGTPVTISTTAISGNTVVLTLASTPSGSVTLDYAWSNAPYDPSTVPSTAVVYDNQSIYGTGGLPLQPHAPMAVT